MKNFVSYFFHLLIFYEHFLHHLFYEEVILMAA